MLLRVSPWAEPKVCWLVSTIPATLPISALLVAGGLGQGNYDPSFPGITAQTAAEINARLRLLWIACGTEDGLFPANQKFIAWLKEKGLQPTAIQTPGMHAWMVWRDNLTNFAPLLFQSK